MLLLFTGCPTRASKKRPPTTGTQFKVRLNLQGKKLLLFGRKQFISSRMSGERNDRRGVHFVVGEMVRLCPL